MKLSEFKKILMKADDEIGVNHMQILENHFFHLKDREKDYREGAIDFAIEKRLAFWNTANNTYELVKRYVSIKCPKCGKPMEMQGGGGSGGSTTVRFRCKECKVESGLTISNEDIYFEFKGGKDE